MKAEIGRRVFVGSVAAGLPLIAGKATVLAQGAGSLHEHASGPADPVSDYIVRQIALIHNSARTAPRGEHLRALATQLRTLAVYQRQLGIDAQVRSALRELVAQQGRNAVLYAEPDPVARREHLQQYGFKLDDRALSFASIPTHAQREATLDGVLRTGVTASFERLAVAADRAAAALDARTGSVIGIAQDDPWWWVGYCSGLWNEYQDAQWDASVVCLIAKYFAPAFTTCAGMMGGAMVLLLAYLYDCSALQ